MLNLIEKLQQNAREVAFADALMFLDESGRNQQSLSYSQLVEQVDLVAVNLLVRLRSVSVQGNPRALLLLDHGPEFLICFLACIRAGITAIPLPQLDPARLPAQTAFVREIIADTGACMVISSGPSSALVLDLDLPIPTADRLSFEQVRLELEWQESFPAIAVEATVGLLYTSGSTSKPKSVAIRHDHLLYNGLSCCDCWQIDRQSRMLSWMPNHHSFGLVFNLVLPLHSGCCITYLSTADFVRSPGLWLKSISEYRISHSAAATFGYQMCSQQLDPARLSDLDLSCWQVGLISAEPVRRGVCRDFVARFKELGLRDNLLVPLYGLSETGPITSLKPNTPIPFHFKDQSPDDLALACVGPALPETAVLCVDPKSFSLLEPGQTGEIWVCGPSVTEGYFNRPQINSQVFASPLGDTRRFFRTGDQGFIGPDGIYITGRLKEIFIIRGKNYYPQDLEWLALEMLEDVGCAACFDSGQEQTQITLALESSRQVEGLEKRAKQLNSQIVRQLGIGLARLVWLAEGSIPKTASGKIKRSACRTGLADGSIPILLEISFENSLNLVPDQSHGLNEPAPQLLSRLFAQVLAVAESEVDLQDPLSELDLDSVQYLQLAQSIEQATGSPFHPNHFFKCETLEDLARVIEDQRGAAR